jgi:hypothetical protein
MLLYQLIILHIVFVDLVLVGLDLLIRDPVGKHLNQRILLLTPRGPRVVPLEWVLLICRGGCRVIDLVIQEHLLEWWSHLFVGRYFDLSLLRVELVT